MYVASRARMPLAMPAIRYRPRIVRLGDLDPTADMQRGARYLFNFKSGGIGLKLDPSPATAALKADSNFGQAIASNSADGIQVSFIYQGRGSSIQGAAAEMQNVLDTYSVRGFFNPLRFSSADGPGSQMATTDQSPQLPATLKKWLDDHGLPSTAPGLPQSSSMLPWVVVGGAGLILGIVAAVKFLK